jgi:L,D-transpeptidase YcbB
MIKNSFYFLAKNCLLVLMLLYYYATTCQTISSKYKSDSLYKHQFDLKTTQYYAAKPSYIQYVNWPECIDSLVIDSLVFNKILFETSQAKRPENQLELWLKRYKLGKYIHINIPNAELKMIENGMVIATMKVILGQATHQTPRLLSFIDFITVYPYWTPTRNITLKELLPKIKKDKSYLEKNNFEVLDNKGQVVDPYTLDWRQFGSNYFPYTLRQGTGCDNSLGLLKFNLVNPYSVYLHDTAHNPKSMSLFDKETRFFSHGCIRLSQPEKLANWALGKEKFNAVFMKSIAKGQKSQRINLPKQLPVLISYTMETTDNKGVVHFYKDIYGLGL